MIGCICCLAHCWEERLTVFRDINALLTIIAYLLFPSLIPLRIPNRFAPAYMAVGGTFTGFLAAVILLQVSLLNSHGYLKNPSEWAMVIGWKLFGHYPCCCARIMHGN